MGEEEAKTLLTEAVKAYSIYSATQAEATTSVEMKMENELKSAMAPVEYPQVSISPADLSTWPKTITINYGPENIVGADNHERRGILTILASNFPTVSGASWEITFSDFYHDDHKVDGKQTISYNGLNENDNPFYQTRIKDGVITTPNNEVFYFEQQTLREWVSGHDTHYITSGEQLDLCDDEFKITGTHSGISSDGYSYSMSTTDPLIVSACCKWVKEGALNVNVDDSDVSCKVEFGPESSEEDSCNNKATFTIFGIAIPITLP